MNPHSRILLKKLFDTYQANPRTISLPITKQRAPLYFEISDVDEQDSLHEALRDAEREGCITLKWGKYAESHLLKSIRLKDHSQLAKYLGEIPATEKAALLESVLKSVVSGKHTWISGLVEMSMEKWCRGKNAHGLSVDQIEEIRLLFMALEAVAEQKHKDMDLRTFSAKVLGDSKAMERMQGRFAAIWRKQFGLEDLEAKELFESIGLSKFPWPIFVKGPIIIISSKTTIDCSNLFPYIGLPPDAILNLKLEWQPDYVLTIENLASFNRYVHEIRDNSLVVYTHGFPSPRLREFLAQIDNKVSKTIPFYHWGDIDVGGFKIFYHIEQTLNIHQLKPHLMDRAYLKKWGEEVDSVDRKTLKRLAHSQSQISDLAKMLLSLEKPLMLEQENVDPDVPNMF